MNVYWCIVEFHNGHFNSVQAPFTTANDAYDQLDKIKAYRKKNPNSLEYTWRITRTLHPDFIG